MLTTLLLIPVVTAAALFLGLGNRSWAKGSALLQLAITLLLWFGYDQSKAGYQFVFASNPLFPGVDLRYSVGVDGLSLMMLLLTAIVTVAAVWFLPSLEKRPNLFDGSVLLISAGATGAFLAKDLFFFYAFHELALVPTFLLIGIWGSGERQAAAWKITVYLGVGSIVLLAGLVDLLMALPASSRTFDLQTLQQLGAAHMIPPAAQIRPWFLLTIGFGILVSLFPFHSWAAPAYAAAPTPVAMLHSGVLKKFGLYGMVRLVLPFLPDAFHQPVWAGYTPQDFLLVALLGNILYVGLATIAQRKLDFMIGYSSVMHMGYVFLGLATLNLAGVSGACLLMFAHGLSVAALFAVSGTLRDREGSLSFDRLGGASNSMPYLGICFAFAAFASIGLPGFANFAGETMIFFGGFSPGAPAFQKTTTVFALWGVVISAVYTLRSYKAVFLGQPTTSAAKWTDLAGSARLALAFLPLTLLLGGFFTRYFLAYLKPSLEAALR